MKARLGILFLLVIMMTGCLRSEIIENDSITSREWDLLLESASGTEVNLYFSSEDEDLEKWLTKSIAPGVKTENNITMNLIRKPMAELLEKLEEQKQNEIENGVIDMIYIDDGSFKQLMSDGLLYGPFVEKLPNYHANVNPEDYEFLFEQGMESKGHYLPVNRDQIMFVYDEDMILEPPSTMETFVETLRSAPGQFTFPLPPEKSGEQFMETFIAAYVDYEALYAAEANRETIEPMLQPALEALEKLRPKLWENGQKFPKDETELDTLFYEGKVSFALSTDPNKPSTLSKKEMYPYAARGFLIDDGTAGSNEGVVIPYSAPNKSGAIIVANYMLSAEAQVYKYTPANGGHIPVVDTSRMDEENARIIKKVTIKRSDMKQEEFNSRRVPKMPEDIKAIVSQIWTEALTSTVEEE